MYVDSNLATPNRRWDPPHQQERGEDFTGGSTSEASVWWVSGSAVALLGKRSWLCVTVCSQVSVSQIEVHRPWLRVWLARTATKPSESPQANGLLFKYLNRSQFRTGECGAGSQQKMVQRLLQRSASLCEARTHPLILRFPRVFKTDTAIHFKTCAN